MSFSMPRLFPYFVILLISIAFMYPLFQNIHNTGRGDWDQFCFFDELPRISILKYHQFPIWDPYKLGGKPSLTNPRYSFLRPTFFLTLLFGCVIGLKLEVFILMTIGMFGMFFLARHYGMMPLSGLLTSFIFGLSSFFTLHIEEGHVNFMGLNFLPYIFLFFLKSFDNKRHIIFSSIFLAMLLGWNPGHFLVPMFIFFSTCGFVIAIQKKSLKPIIHLIFIFIIASGLGAVKFIPTFEYALSHPRLTSAEEFTPFKGIYNIFLMREQVGRARAFDTQVWGWWEYGAYTGLLPLLLTAVGVFFFWEKQTALILAGFFAFIMSLGSFAKWSPWYLLHKLPLINSLRVPSRFIILAIFSIAIISGLAANKLFKKYHKSLIIKFMVFTIVAISITDLFFVSRRPLLDVFSQNLIAVDKNNDFYQIIDNNPTRSGSRSSMYLNLLSNKGTLNAYDVAYDAEHSKVFAKDFNDEEYKGEVYLEDDGKASYAFWSPNKLSFNVDVENETRLVINQNYDAGWRVKGKVAENFNGLLSTIVTPSDKTVEFYYLPASFIIGLIVTLVSIISVVTFSFKYLKKENHR